MISLPDMIVPALPDIGGRLWAAFGVSGLRLSLRLAATIAA